MKKLEFKPEDFLKALGPMSIQHIEVVRLAEDKFDQWYKENIEYAPVVFCQNGGTDMEANKKERWVGKAYSIPSDTHKARLVCIEEIEKKQCEHKRVGLGNGFSSHTFYCTECNKSVRPKTGWEVCE